MRDDLLTSLNPGRRKVSMNLQINPASFMQVASTNGFEISPLARARSGLILAKKYCSTCETCKNFNPDAGSLFYSRNSAIEYAGSVIQDVTNYLINPKAGHNAGEFYSQTRPLFVNLLKGFSKYRGRGEIQKLLEEILSRINPEEARSQEEFGEEKGAKDPLITRIVKSYRVFGRAYLVSEVLKERGLTELIELLKRTKRRELIEDLRSTGEVLREGNDQALTGITKKVEKFIVECDYPLNHKEACEKRREAYLTSSREELDKIIEKDRLLTKDFGSFAAWFPDVLAAILENVTDKEWAFVQKSVSQRE